MDVGLYRVNGHRVFFSKSHAPYIDGKNSFSKKKMFVSFIKNRSKKNFSISKVISGTN